MSIPRILHIPINAMIGALYVLWISKIRSIQIAKIELERAHRAGESELFFSASLRSTDRSGKGV